MSDGTIIAVKTKIYLDTTVPSACFDQRTPERMRLTVRFWEQQLLDYEACISRLLLDEVGRIPDLVTRHRILQLVHGLRVLEVDRASDSLAQIYLREGVFPLDAEADSSHVALAVTNRIEYLISWNYRHLVKTKTRKRVNEVNAEQGWGPIDIISPPEL
jgi:hypothetical protein